MFWDSQHVVASNASKQWRQRSPLYGKTPLVFHTLLSTDNLPSHFFCSGLPRTMPRDTRGFWVLPRNARITHDIASTKEGSSCYTACTALSTPAIFNDISRARTMNKCFQNVQVRPNAVRFPAARCNKIEDLLPNTATLKLRRVGQLPICCSQIQTANIAFGHQDASMARLRAEAAAAAPMAEAAMVMSWVFFR